MKEEIKERWVAALRSGEYSQTKEKLKDETGYCCLGVLCELAVADGVIKPANYQFESWGYPTRGYADADVEWDEASVLPWEVIKWAELNESNPVVTWQEHRTNISEPNDESASFLEIASIIEEQL